MRDSEPLKAPKTKFRSLERTMIVWFLLMGLVPLGLVSWFGYQQTLINLTHDAEEDLKNSSELSARFIHNWFEYRLMDLNAQAGSYDNAHLLKQLKAGLKKSYTSPANYVKSSDWSKRVADANNDLESFSQLYDYIYDLFLIDNAGNILYTVAHESDLGASLMDGAYAGTRFASAVKNTQKTGKVSFSGLDRYAPSNYSFGGFITAPVLDEGGNKLGVFAIQLRFDRIFDLLHSTTSAESTLTDYLVDKEGQLQTPVGKDDWSDVLSRVIDTERVRLSQNEQMTDAEVSISEYIGPAGKTVLGVHHQMKLADINWVLISEINRDEVLASAGRLAELILILIGFTSIILIFVAVYLARRITRPIASLADASMKVAAGEIDQYVEINSNDEIGKLASSFNHMLDMRQFHEQALEQSAREAQYSLDALADQKFALNQHAIVAVTDGGGTITFANDKFSEISGYSHDELIGNNHRILKSGYHDPEFFTEMFKKITSGQVWHAEVCNKAKDGSLYWVDTTIVPFVGDNGPENYIAIRTDITERKRTEDALIEAKFEAEAAVLAKGEFLASMSHEIRTPMNGVLGMLGLLLNTDLDHDQAHKAKIAQSSAKSLLTLINDILDFSKIEAGKLDLEIIDFKLHDMLGDLAEAMALQAQTKGLELILDLTAVGETMVRGDPGRLRQILTNLISNAIKFTSEGEITIRVELQEMEDQTWKFCCNVIDSGIGIPVEKIESLFDSFSQADASTTRKFGGTGLGLSIVRKLCELMDGIVHASSVDGQGSNFEVNVILQKSSQSQQVVPQVDMQSLNLLVVDDNATNREVLRIQFEQWGANVVEVKSGKEALAICEDRIQQSDQAFFDIALLDMKMPEMDGAELGQAFKSDDRFSDMKLVMMTSIASQGDAKRFAEIGFSAYFPKPATTADLFDALAVIAEGGEALEQAQPLVTHHYLKSLDREAHDENELDEDRFESTLGRVRWPANSRVLLVEDNQINQLVAKGLLKGFGLHVDITNNGAEAVDMLSQADDQTTYDLILMDCEMPVMDGYEATRQIRLGNAGEQNKEIPIVAMTANVMQGIRQKCTAAGMSDYLAKPIEPELLSAKLQEWLIGVAAQKVTEETDAEVVESEPLVWDKEAALKRLVGDEALLMIVLDAFVSDMPVRLDELQKALNVADYDQAYRSAHSIKGVAGNLGGLLLQQQAARMESAAKEKNKDQLISLMPDFQKAHQQLMDCFKDYKRDQDLSDLASDKSLTISDEELIIKLQTLEVRLQQSDYIDPQELAPLRQTNLDQVTQDLLGQLINQISQFDNEAALEILGKIARIEGYNLTEEIQE